MKALVTGGTGFIGSHLVEELMKEGFSTTCLVRKDSDLKWIENYPMTYVVGDCVDNNTLKNIFSDFDYVFHVAGLTKAVKTEDFYCTNVTGTENLLHAIKKYNKKLKRFVHISSIAVAGPSKEGMPLNASVMPEPVSEYGKSKLMAENFIQAQKTELPVTIIRPPAVYGPRDKDFYLVFKMIQKGLFPYWGKAYYSLIYVEDLAKGIIKAIKTDKTIGNTYYLTDDNIYSNDELADTIAKQLGCKYVKVKIPHNVIPMLAHITEILKRKSIINSDKAKELKYSHWLCSCEEAKKDFGFQTQVGLKEGIKWTANWYKIHKWL
ncbi:MAG: NAD(P)-dependent oxidoreductase [Candidatus Magnetoovum sp. WYHC-5]|nr:NAD(P)-dependent oxidoreductase [Candidatus Magnetoovum sp. WYHC-5]